MFNEAETTYLNIKKIFQIIAIVKAKNKILPPIYFLNQLQGFLRSLWMTFGTTLGEHLTMTASANMFYIAIHNKNKANVKLAASNRNIKRHQLF